MNFLKNKIHRSFFLFGTIIIVLVFVLSFISKTKVTTATGLLPFGGEVTERYYCACSGNYAITIEGVKGGVFSFYDGGTTLYDYGQTRPGVWQLGTYSPGGECLIPGEPCTVGRTPIGIMTQVGTSLTL